ncbi:MAG TPA: peptidoglycan-binding protein [Nostocaceae cyanobacterium]|nr:peptidoglycan-binding protein [Nostocaceae cyanobacterium]
MENLAYLHLACAYEDNTVYELVSLGSLLNTATTPDWKRFSGKAWKHLLPLMLTLSILSSVTSALALQKGDQGPSVRNLQQRLKSVGFYQAPITQVYDLTTEEAVRRFQKAAGLPVNGVVGAKTLQQLETWQPKSAVLTTTTSSSKNTQVNQTTKATVVPTMVSSSNIKNPNQAELGRVNITTQKRRNPNYLSKGDEGKDVEILQERLRVAGFYQGRATGIYGPITEEGVKQFQAANKLDVDGIVGPATLAKLPPLSVANRATSPQKPVSRANLKFANLKLGDRGEAVSVLQTQLIQAGYLKGKPNGYYGSYTADAVSRFQKAQRLAVNGIADSQTRSQLNSLVKTSSQTDLNVLEIQKRLQEQGFYQGPVNGFMSPATRTAIKQAQEFYGISLSDIRSGSY